MGDSDSMGDEPMVGVQGPPEADDSEDSSDLSSDESSSDEAEIPPEKLERVMALESELEANNNLYDRHVEYTELLRELRLRGKLMQARERMASKFPLSELMWMDWINDEMQTIEGTEDLERIKGLYKRAVEDYLSVQLWVAYLDFLKLDPEVAAHTPQGIKTMRDACEAALTAASLHVSEAGSLWAIFREYEKAVLEGMGEDLGKERQKQEERVRSLYTRQVQVPLAGNKEVLEEYKAWEEARGKTVSAHVLKGAEKAQDDVSLRASYEEAVAPDTEPDAERLTAYVSYVKLEQAQGDPARVQLVYERAVAAFPVTEELWAQYCHYLDDKLHQMPAVLARVAKRAARNCYWSGRLWVMALRAADRAGQSLEEIKALGTMALTAGLQSQEEYLEVLLTYLDALRHRTPTSSPAAAAASPAGQALRAAFQDASNLMAQYFPDQPDRLLRLPSYWAHCELHVLGDVAAARQVWEAALQTQLAKYAEVWLEYARMEQSQRNIKEARTLYKKAAARKLEESGLYTICMDWLNFERKEGSAEDYAQALAKVNPVLEQYAPAAAAATADQQATAAAQVARLRKAVQLSKEEMKARRQANDPNFKGGKAAKAALKAAKGQGKRPADTDAHEEPGQKKPRLQEPGVADQADTAMEADMGVDTDMQDADQHGAAEGGQHVSKKGAAYDLQHSVFVRGLPPEVNPEALKQFFSDCGHIVAVRIPRFPGNGPYRNFGYVDFHTDDAVTKAVAKHGSKLPGSEYSVQVAKSAPPGSAGRGRGRGRGRGGRFDRDQHDEGNGQDAQGQEQHGQGRGRGRGREPYRGANKLLGLGYAGRHVNTRHPHQHLQLDAATATPGGAPSTVPSTSLMPRSVAMAQRGQAGQPKGAAPMDTDVQAKPKSNADFRAMLPSGKK